MGRRCRRGDLTAAGVGETLDGLLGKNTHPDVRQNAAPYTAIMQNAGFGSLEILLKYDDVELNEMHDQLIKDGIPRGHSMEIRKQIKLRRPNGGSGNAGSTSAIDPSVGPPAPPPPLPRPMSPEEVYIEPSTRRPRMDVSRGEAEQVERAQIEEPADSTAVEPKHKRLGKKEKAPLPSFIPDYVEPPSGMVEAIRDELEEVAATPVGLAGTLSEPRVDRNARAALLRDAKQAAPGAPVPSPPKGSHHRPRSEGSHHQPSGARSAADTLRTGASILAHVARFEPDSSRLNRLRASPVASG